MDKNHSLLLTHHIKPDYGFYVQADDRLLCIVHSSVASLLVRFSGYFLAYDGTIKQYAVEIAPTSDRAATTATQFFGEGIILSCTTQLVTGNADRGQLYVRARVQRGTGATALPIARLVAGYLTDDFTPSFPYGRIEGALDGPGMTRAITGTNPAAGAESSETVPTGATWLLRSWSISLVDDGTVATRQLGLVVDNGTTELFRTYANTTQAASQTRTYNALARFIEPSSVVANIWLALPSPLVMPAGWRIRTVTSSIQAGDDYGAPQIVVEEHLEA